LRDSGSEYWVFIVNWDHDGFVGDVCCIFSWYKGRPVEIDIVLPMIDEGAKEVEVVSSSVHTDEDNTMFGAEGEDGGGRKAIAMEVGMLIHVLVIGVVVGVGREDDGGLLSEARVLILVGCCSKSASNSGAWRSLELTHES